MCARQAPEDQPHGALTDIGEMAREFEGADDSAADLSVALHAKAQDSAESIRSQQTLCDGM